ncbi:MAG: PIN domain-containing protein [Candidatus Acididesulfobacter guangdongensis]|uniref:PIN domain-containing protein n=1 Tax=Acididesulfobacter guangdongensis TaxID=2597225 RepID=A0A519BI04_ACIG2|nr:MAG: PIN domain-containing protein [Candidatus Acididesulfobacter guangdongensis]
MKFVLDNSITMRWLFGDEKKEDLDYAIAVLETMKEAEASVPAIWGLEVSNVIAKAEAKGLIAESRSTLFIQMLNNLDIQPDMQTYLYSLNDILNLARRYGLSAYDASYLELALRRNIPLATLDEDLIKAVKKSGTEIYKSA